MASDEQGSRIAAHASPRQPSSATLCSNMSVLDVFTCPVVYKHKTRVFSFSTLVVVTLVTLTIFGPFLIVYWTGGFWLRNRIYVETPSVNFAHRYILVAETDFDAEPIVCSTFSTYKSNPISDDCTFVKVHEADVNRDRRNDILKIEARFSSDWPIRTLRLLLFYRIELKELIEANIETMVVFDCTLLHDVQKVHFIGDLKLNQKSLLRVDNFPEIYNYSIDLGDKSLSEVLSEHARNKLSARLANTHVTWQTGFSNEEPVTVSGEIFYSEELIHYQPGFWEEIKWAWIQYLSVFLVFIYLTAQTLRFLFTNRYLNSYVIVPWREK